METKKINGKAVVSLILSCLSVLCCFAWYLAIIVGMIGVVLGIIAYRESEGGQRDLAIAGIIVPSASPEPSAFPEDGSGSMMFALRRLWMWF